MCARRQMCAGTIYWAGIGGLVYGAAEEKLRDPLAVMRPDQPLLPALSPSFVPLFS